MQWQLKYGRNYIPFDCPDQHLLSVVEPRDLPGVFDPTQVITHALRHPIGTKSLSTLVSQRKLRNVVIIVNDISRPTPYKLMLPPLLAELHNAGVPKEAIRFVVATGIHPAHTAEQNRELFGEECTASYPFSSHDPDHQLVHLGLLSTGTPLYVNQQVYESDFIITTGMIMLHYFAGFSGGRKSILPGVAGRVTIQQNHARMLDMLDCKVPIDENEMSLEMIEAAQKVGVDFTFNVITNSQQEIVKVVAGDVVQAWQEGIATADQMFHCEVPRRADVTIVSGGGYPKDLNVYQAQKALQNADLVTNEGGLIILLAECSQGLGDPTFAQWMREATRPEDNLERIQRGFVLGGHKAFAISRIAACKEIILISSLDQATTESLFFHKMQTLAEALHYAETRFGKDFAVIILPHGGLVQPVLANSELD